MCVLSVGASAPNPDTRNFSGKVSWNFKSFCQNKVVYSVRKFCGFLRRFFKSTLKQGLERSSNISRKIKKHGNAVLFVCIISWGFRPNPDQRTFREKSFGNPKVFDKMKWCCLVQSSLAHLSAKERCVLLLTFLSKKSKPYRVFL